MTEKEFNDLEVLEGLEKICHKFSEQLEAGMYRQFIYSLITRYPQILKKPVKVVVEKPKNVMRKPGKLNVFGLDFVGPPFFSSKERENWMKIHYVEEFIEGPALRRLKSKW